VLIAQAVFLLGRGQTNRQTDTTERITHAGGYAGVGNNIARTTSVLLVLIDNEYKTQKIGAVNELRC